MFQAPTGTQDILPEDAPYWTFVEAETRRQASLGGYGEIRTPTFEDTRVFLKGVGDTTDIVEKEMYSFRDKGGDSLTLRPEGTAPIIRAYLERHGQSPAAGVKLFTLLNAFRHDRPQKGRYREFHQIDFEVIGEDDPLADAELVALQWRLYQGLGLRDLSLQVNSIGDPVRRPGYIKALTEYFEAHTSGLCEDCQRRLQTNPLRLLDEKKRECQAVLEGAPHSTDHLCVDCRAHFETWIDYLERADLPYQVNSRMVRGLDYYTRSVWEVWPRVQGGQSTVGGGGRYDGLAELLGGRATPGVGFASGIERIILELKDQEVPIPGIEAPRVYFAFQNEGGKRVAFRLAESLRQAGIGASVAFGARRLNKQLDAANKSGAQLAVIIGEDELANATVSIKDLRTGGDQRTVAQAELVDELKAEHGPTD